MELKRYLVMAWRWTWLAVIGVIVGGAAGYYYSIYQVPVFRAQTRFVILRAAQSSDYYAYLDNQQLVQTYIQLLTTDVVLNSAATELGYPIRVNQASARQIGETQFVELTVEDTDRERVANIANVLVTTLIDQNEKLQSVRYSTSEQNLKTQIELVQSQIAALQAQINDISSTAVQDQVVKVQSQMDDIQTKIIDLQNQITELKKQYPTPEIKAQIIELQAGVDQFKSVMELYRQVYTNLVVLGKPVENANSATTKLSQLQSTLSLYQQIYMQLLGSLQTIQLARVQNTPNVVHVEPAASPSFPVRPRPIQNMLLSGMLGFILAAGIAFLVEYLDDTIKTLDDIEHTLHIPVIGYVAKFGGKTGEYETLYVVRQPRSPIAEAFRSLRTNLEFAGVDRPLRKILVTSASPSEGKTTISANLAAIMAHGGRRVILFDADLRRPKVHRVLGLSNQFGLSDLFRGNMVLETVKQTPEGLENISVVTSGSLPPNPTELLASSRMNQILQKAEKVADIVIIDSPPSLVADAQVLASKVDGVLLVIYPGHTKKEAAIATLEQLNRAGAHVIGIVLNRISRTRAINGGYRHYAPYYSGHSYYGTDEGKGKNKNTPWIRRLIGAEGASDRKPAKKKTTKI